MRHMLLITALLAVLPFTALAASLPSEKLHNSAEEARAEGIFVQLRCLVCQNETIADSEARIAHDLRQMVRERIAAGDSDTQILDYVHSRYGDFVLMRPPVKPSTLGLWFGPAIILILGGALVIAVVRRQGRGAA